MMRPAPAPTVWEDKMTEALPSHASVAARLIREDSRFAVEKLRIRGTDYTVFANAPPNVRTLFEQAEDAYGTREMLVAGDRRWTYGQLRRDVAALAHALGTLHGIKPGDRVAVGSRNHAEMVLLVLAITATGASVVPLNAWWSGTELVRALNDCGARLVFADGERFGRLAPVLPAGLTLIGIHDAPDTTAYETMLAADPIWPEVEIAPEAEFAVMYSSGSSGVPKGVIQTHRNVISAIWSWYLLRVMAPELAVPARAPALPSWLIISPLFHVTALYANFFQGLQMGAKIVLMPRWSADEAVDLIRAENVTRISGVPTQSADLAEAVERRGLTLPSLENITGGGDKRPAAQVEDLNRVFPATTIAIGWGMTETCALGINLSGPEYLEYPDAAGRLAPPVQEMRIVDDAGNDVAPGEMGEFLIRSPAVTPGYLNDPTGTAAAIRDGWLLTGDLARVGSEGFIQFCGRKKNMIVRGGENIACAEVENAIYEHPAVEDACVFAVPHPRLGETVGAAVHLLPDTTLTVEELAAFLAPLIARFKQPERLWVLDAPLPRGATEKIDRKVIQRHCLSLQADGAR